MDMCASVVKEDKPVHHNDAGSSPPASSTENLDSGGGAGTPTESCPCVKAIPAVLEMPQSSDRNSLKNGCSPKDKRITSVRRQSSITRQPSPRLRGLHSSSSSLNMSSFTEIDELVLSSPVGSSQSLAPLPKENVVVPPFRILPKAELTEDDSTRAEPTDDETEEHACAEYSIAKRHAPSEVLERRQIIRIRNMTIPQMVSAMQTYRDSFVSFYEKFAAKKKEGKQANARDTNRLYNKPVDPKTLTPLPTVPNNHHLFDALPEPEKKKLLDLLTEQLEKLSYVSELRPDSETSWEAMNQRCIAHEEQVKKEALKALEEEEALKKKPVKGRKSQECIKRRSSTGTRRSSLGKRGKKRRKKSDDSEESDPFDDIITPVFDEPDSSMADDSDTNGTSLKQSFSPKQPSETADEHHSQRSLLSGGTPPPLKRINIDRTTHIMECPPEILDSLSTPGTTVEKPWMMLKLRTQMHPGTHRPRNLVYIHCAVRPPPPSPISPRRRRNNVAPLTTSTQDPSSSSHVDSSTETVK